MGDDSTRSGVDPLAALAGGGEMGRRIRAFDWSATPLGPIDGWPQGLRSALSICLNSNFPIAVYWGADLVLLYNDEWSPIPGEKHPWALGRPAREAWPEIWHIIEPLFERVLATGEATRSRDQLLPMHRHGFTEECYFDYTFSPIRGEGGHVEGVFNAVLETTTRVIGERRLRSLRELGAWKTGEARTAEEACRTSAHVLAENPHDLPFTLLYLPDGDRRAVLAGQTGLGRDTGASPAAVDLDSADAPWPFRRVAEAGKPVEVDDLPARFGPLPGAAWPESPRRAVVLPLAKSGQTDVAGFVVAGVSPRLALDDDYRGFLDLLAGHVAAAVASARAYEEERKRAEALAELDRAKTAFFSNVSHEFRTPLTLMLGPVEDALADTASGLPPAQRERVEVAHRNGLRLQRLVNGLLDFSRIEAGRVKATYEPTDLAALTADLASNFRSACEKAGLTLTVDCPAVGEPVFVDRPMWEKVVLNLLSNAFKFTLNGGIAVALRQMGRSVELRVRDTGTGIPAAEMPRLFERFHRVENARGRTHEGSGIGLALVQELVRLHGGAIAAESEVGKGTTFTVTIPLGSDHLPRERVGTGGTTAPTTGASPFVEEALRWLPDAGGPDDLGRDLPERPNDLSAPAPSLRPDAERPRVLVADDNADMRRYVERLLSGAYSVEAVADGVAALDCVRRQRPDLILSDVMMPRLDGFGLLRELRADPTMAGVPVILLSARAGEESRVEGVEAGADDYLVKPFSARELLARVTAQVQLARLRREAGEALRQSHAQFEALFDAAPVGVYLVDADLKIRQVNPKARPVFGDIPDLIGSDFGEVVHALWPKPYADEIVGRFRRTLETGEPYSVPERVEERVDRRATEYYEWQIHRIPLPDGRYGVVCYFSDVSRHVQARLELAESGRQLRESEERYRTLFESMDEGYCIIEVIFDPPGSGRAVDYRFIEVNPAFEAQSGMRDVTGRRMREFVPSIESHWLENYGRVALTGEPVRFANEYTGLNRWFEVYAFRVGPPGGHRVAVLFTDVTARKHGEREREELVSRLKEQDRQKDEFLATLAHELRNPLAPIRNGLQVMRLSNGEREAVEKARTMMERQLSQLVHLVDDLLDLSRISRGKIELRKERVELARVIQQAVETSRPQIEANGHDLTITVPPGPVYVDADVTRLAQVFSNLLNNAAKYTERGGRVELAVRRQGGEVVVSVKDNGVGIPAHMVPRVFEMFTQVDRHLERSQGGLGIGLSIVKKLVEMHGGSVGVESDGPGTGSEFTVRLPVVLAVARPTGGEEEPAPPSGRRRVLVVDDNEDAAMSLAMMLNLMGNEAKTAHDGLEALDVAAAFRPDLILLDIGMPRLNGHETARRIRAQPWGKDVVLVALTGWGQEEDRRKSGEAGFDSHMVKPVEPAALEKLLAALRADTA